jgi:hypothetical protein
MINTYAVVIDPDMDVHTIKINNLDDSNQQVGMYNLVEWLGSSEMGRFEFAPNRCMWFAPVDDVTNVVAVGLLGNRVVIRGNVVITTWTKKGPESEGIPENELTETWSWIEELITYNKAYMKDSNMTLDELRQFVEEGI